MYIDPNSIVEAAISSYLDFLGDREEYIIPDVENIHCILTRPTAAAKREVTAALQRAFGQKLSDATQLRGLRDLLVLHPGFRDTSRALSMMLQSFDYLGAGDLVGQ